MAILVRYNCVLYLFFWLFSLEMGHLDLPGHDPYDYCLQRLQQVVSWPFWVDVALAADGKES